MKNILLIGGGRSATVLIDYLIKTCEVENWKLTIAELDTQILDGKIPNSEVVNIIQFNVSNPNQLEQWVRASDIIISMLPPHFHSLVAKSCIQWKKDMVTASYISPEMKALNDEAINAGITILNEIGVDPGIDHLSAMKTLDELRDSGCEVIEFETFTGGLPAPESDNNPWKYKFTWSPRNVVLAGQGGVVKFLHNQKLKYIPYQRVFRRTEYIEIDGIGEFEGYANRDSLKYQKLYKLENVHTLYRGTLRRPGFSKAWDIFVQIGATDDSYTMEGTDTMTHKDFINSFLPYHHTDSVELKLAHAMRLDLDSEEMRKIQWLGLFTDELVGVGNNATPAQVLQKILEKKWSIKPGEKDMIVMWHKYVYIKNGKIKEKQSSMVCIGEDSLRTAMAKTVGLPVGIATKKILKGEISEKGVILPLQKDTYNAILNELETFDIKFIDKQIIE
jgi:saccharopine dehydrogenase-like NADP-dependent oxidoreductase